MTKKRKKIGLMKNRGKMQVIIELNPKMSSAACSYYFSWRILILVLKGGKNQKE